MTLEQRVEALEMVIANMNIQRQATETTTTIANREIKKALRPGGMLYAAQKQAANYKASLEMHVI